MYAAKPSVILSLSALILAQASDLKTISSVINVVSQISDGQPQASATGGAAGSEVQESTTVATFESTKESEAPTPYSSASYASHSDKRTTILPSSTTAGTASVHNATHPGVQEQSENAAFGLIQNLDGTVGVAAVIGAFLL